MRVRKSLPLVVLSGMLPLCHVAIGEALDDEIHRVGQTLSTQLVAKQRPKIATLDFTDLQGRPNELGRFLAEQLSVDMVAAVGVTVVDRANISAVMAEHKLTAEGLVNPENARKLGQFAGVDALLIGNVAAMDGMFTMTIRAISTETAEIVAAGRCRFDITQDMMKQYSTALSASGVAAVGGNGVGSGAPTSQDSSGIARKAFGNLEVVLMTVSSTWITLRSSGGWRVPVVRCSLEVVNNDLRNSFILAANGTKMNNSSQIVLTAYRGELCDSNGTRWWMPDTMLKGLSAVMCCDGEVGLGNTRAASQNNPTAVADYIKRGTRCSFGFANEATIRSGGRNWTGSFSTVPPGGSLRINADFIPCGEGVEQSKTRMPDSFEFAMEVVMGTVAGDEVPEKAKDLRLENLVFDKVVMPIAVAVQP